MSDGSRYVERAEALWRTGRSELALEELAHALAEDPEDAHAHAIQAQALADLNRLDEALEAVQRAIGAAPDHPYPFFVEANLWLRRGKPKAALASANEAVRLEPLDPDHHAAVAASYAGLSRWRDVVEAAERGLAISAEDVQCTNLRALGLRQLGETDEAEAALEGALAGDPENAWTFQNLGFAALKSGKADEAVAHFRESLRLDPTDDASRVGLAEALKARVPLYRPIIAWQMLCARLSSAAGVGLILGFFVLNNVLQRTLPEGSTLATVLLVAYASLVWMSWSAAALFDVLLLLRSDLRPLLERRERVAAAGVLACIVVAAALVALRIATGLPGLEWQALAAAFAAIPVAGWPGLANGKARAVGVLVAVAALVTLLGAVVVDLVVLQEIRWSAETRMPEEQLTIVQARAKMASVLGSMSLLISVGSSWLLLGLGFVPESRGGRGTRRRPR